MAVNIRRLIIIAVIASVFFAFPFRGIFSYPEPETKDFYFSRVLGKIEISSDGSFLVDEYRTYDFQGTFRWASLWIPLRVDRQGYGYAVSIEDFEIRDENNHLLRTEVDADDRRYSAKWYYAARNEERTFHIRYHVRGGIVSYPEVSELYWQVIGSGWDRPTAKAAFTVRLPESAPSRKALQVFGHGPLTGWAEIVDDRTARFTAENLPAHQYFEIRFIWPSGMVRGVPSSRHNLESIKKEEARFVQETVERARKARERRDMSRRNFLRIAVLWGFWCVAGPLIWLAVYIRFWMRIGRDYRFDDIPLYFRELPSDLSPALVQVLMREGRTVTPNAFTATLFDMARRGYIEIEDRPVEKRTLFGVKEEIETSAILRRDYENDNSVAEHEKDLLDLLFVTVGGTNGKKGDRIGLESLKDFLRKKAPRFQTWYRSWVKTIAEEAKGFGFIEPESLRARNIFLGASLPVAVLTVNPLLILFIAVLTPKMKRRSLKWARENEMWKALDRFLDDFSDFEELPPEAYKLWEHYLVFGILFGNAKKILKKLPIVLQDERSRAPGWYAGYDRAFFVQSGRLNNMISSISHFSSSISQASTSAAHYSSGGGGGFSGRGGGGGGGGGGSAG